MSMPAGPAPGQHYSPRAAFPTWLSPHGGVVSPAAFGGGTSSLGARARASSTLGLARQPFIPLSLRPTSASASRRAVRSAMVLRLSHAFLPLATPISTLARPFRK
ncbi:hypothetical protein FB381_3575 [Nocardioides albertanoniae]|uniref:Uncharacterized protein n=1 Tax=Nocardioides albertanoniae TaxID=1175486 RepID=A0A543AAM7_9ACTN|nr:hypothetical protein FB381_3575 [Nocardioides albertanoniae]